MINRTYSILFFLLAAGIIVDPCCIALPSTSRWTIKKYSAMVRWVMISRGGIPHRDFFDHKPPLIYFLYFLGFRSAAGAFG